MSTAPLDDLAALLAPLHAPFECKSLKAPNRFCMAPMSRYFAPGGVLGDDGAEYYRRRAAAGIGTIITEGTGVAIDQPDGREQLMPSTQKAGCLSRNCGTSVAV
jgi:2,4-dienoyl-CoA reductase-like NADH-dependent reductase (Old Yellow Enzyme family)